MQAAPPQLYRSTKIVLYGAGALAVVAGPVLFFFPDDTGRTRSVTTARVGLLATIAVTALQLLGALLNHDQFTGPAWARRVLPQLLGDPRGYGPGGVSPNTPAGRRG